MENLQLRITSLEGIVYVLADKILSKEDFQQFSKIAQAVPSKLHEQREKLKQMMRQADEAEDPG